MTETTRAVIYAAKSTEDRHGSIPTQLDDCRALAERNGWVVVAEHQDEGFSAYSGNRGPGLAAVKQALTEHAPCVLVVQHTDRLARGAGDAPGAADHLMELYFALGRMGVRLWSVQSGEVDRMRALLEGERNTEDSKRKSEAVRSGKRRQLARGDHLGGPVCDGYRIVPVYDGTGQVVGREFALDPVREPVLRSIFEAAGQGVPDGHIARMLNADGVRTRHGRPFTRRAIQNTVTNPWYAARVAYKRGTPDEEIVDGHHPALVDPAEFDRIQRTRAVRDLASPDQKVVGRPAQNHALARLAVCSRCGERLYAVTSSYRRRDGSRARTYVCHSYRFSTGTCGATPISAEIVDAAVIAGLDTLLVDFEALRRRIEDEHASERNRLTTEVERARLDRDAQTDRATKVETKWAEYVAADDSRKADLVLPMVEREREAAAAAERRLQAARDALASVPTEAPADAMLDFANALQAAIRGRVDRTGSLAEVNLALREMFSCFLIREDRGDSPFDGILIQPWLRPGVLVPPGDPELGWAWPKLVNADDGPMPLRWLSSVRDSVPQGNVTNSHE